jgi:hypothetical protein
MKEKLVDYICKKLNVTRHKDQPIGDYLSKRDLENEIPQLEIDILKALFRYAGQELRKRL